MSTSALPDSALQLETSLFNDLPALSALCAALARNLLARLPKADPAEGWVIQILADRGALEQGPDGWQPTAALQALLDDDTTGFTARAEFTAMAARDMLRLGPALAHDRATFMQAAETFRFFSYDRARGTGAAQLEDTAPWVAYVTALSRREAPALAPLIPVQGCRTLLEIGGNTGVMAEALLERNPDLSAIVLDLPAVCHLGEKRMKGRALSQRLSFLPGDARERDWPPCDAILFKSVLHDWSADQARAMLLRAAAHLPPGGRLIVCERGEIAQDPAPRGLAAAANLVFASFYRAPRFYADIMAKAGLHPLPPSKSLLDMTFHITSAEKPRAP